MADLEFTEDLTPEETSVLEADKQAEFEPEAPAVSEPVEPVEEPVEEEKPPTQVPYGVLREERDRRQALEGEVAASRENVRRLEQMFTQLTEKMGQPTQQETEPVPDWDEDPDAYTRHMLDRLERRLGGMEQTQQQTAAERQARAQEQQFMSAYQNSVQQFNKPDFKDAYEHVVKTMDDELQHRGFYDPMQRAEILRAEERAVVERAFAAGKNPAEMIYNYAGFRGYKAPIGGDKLATIDQGQRAAAALPPGSGDSAPNVSLERLAEADGDEFDKLWNEAQRKGMLG